MVINIYIFPRWHYWGYRSKTTKRTLATGKFKVENMFYKDIGVRLTSPVEMSNLNFSRGKNPKFF
jgi:hypothetical protein